MPRNFLEVHVPISPRTFFFNRIRYLAKSLRSFGGELADSKIIVSVGDPAPTVDLDQLLPWAREEGVEWRWVDRKFFAAWHDTGNPYIATMMDRFRAGFRSEYVIIADADILFLRDPASLFTLLKNPLDVGGVMAHVSPFLIETEFSHTDWWNRLFAAFDLPQPILEFEHSGWGLMFEHEPSRYSPAYFNSGMIVGSGEAMNRMAQLALPALKAVRSVLDTFFFDQIAFTLMMYKAKVNKRLIPIRYNFPNQAEFEEKHREDAASISVLHYLRTETVDRDAIFESAATLRSFVARGDLSGANEQLRARIEALQVSWDGND